ncbi:MAG: glycosyltransferase family 2 protein [Chloroflexi bacterium AL-W]|nr:glycosyltransferase family 2 protein [Chloroflexi bacterium AL-N1]NOK69784.1 glycosyltransferase family 2 protein [Chloroflexi bacterium AL-N10]NOK73612.1 glycosyltransferase family 2 protein [Chloroflexi bacterium AL-N5]NOK83954.1 glycosyltransferase family 2 protein [Chloroflexi bacterium AL-W]NOK87943.1 glycosyltransferase family 2 protein [Chloroflexi bacterium AL-N15]
MKLSLVIPCYNESENIAQLHDQLCSIRPELDQRGPFELIFVDDGSNDETFTHLSSVFSLWNNVKIVQHDRNRGLGQALRTGFTYATGEVIVTTDSDGTYPFTTIPELLDLLQPGVDIVTASPYHPQGGVDGVPACRLLFSKGASALYRVLINPRLHTYTAMYRAYRREVIDTIPTAADGFLMVTELMVGALLADYHATEYPAVLRVRRYGQSKARVWQITRSHLRFQASILKRRLGMSSRTVAHSRGT